MDAIAQIMLMLLSLTEPCTASVPVVQAMGGETVQTMQIACGAQSFQVLTRLCANERGESYPGRPFYLEADDTSGFYVNQFGEVLAGRHVSLDNVYFPLCGS